MGLWFSVSRRSGVLVVESEQDVQSHRVTVVTPRSDLERGVAGLDLDAGQPTTQAGRHDEDVPAVRRLPPPL